MNIKSIAHTRFLIAAAAAALGSFSATPAHSAIVTMTFTGTYDSLQSVAGTVDGITQTAGLTASGSLSFNSAALSLIDDGLHASPPGIEQIYAGPVTFTATIGSNSYTATSVDHFYMSNALYTPPNQYFEADALPPAISPGNSVTMVLDSESSTPSLFGSSADPGSFFSHTIAGEFYLQDSSNSKLVFDVTENVSAVPEPSTWTTMILGFLGIAFMAYRKKDALRFA
jgi:hypothetical protein